MTHSVPPAEHAFTSPTASDPAGRLFEGQVGVAEAHHLEARLEAHPMSSSNTANLMV